MIELGLARKETTQMGRLAGKVAVVTGGTRGLGLAIARAFAAEGAQVVLAGRTEAGVQSALAQLRQQGLAVWGRACDVADLEQVQRLAADALRECGALDIWVNNAGVAAPYGPSLDVAPSSSQQVMETNILGVYNGSTVALRHFLSQGKGKLINVLGMGARGPAPMQNAYGASKAWVRSFTRSLAQEYRRSGVGVFAFSPGMTRTELLLRPDVIAGYEGRMQGGFQTVLRMWSELPEVPAAKAVWIASRATDGRTGLTISASGPLHLLVGALRELVRRILHQPGETFKVEVRTVPGVTETLK
jgi:NAD(P)-dependent dehydrogenase (short-subunit alcohol dehydrogenase family)